MNFREEGVIFKPVQNPLLRNENPSGIQLYVSKMFSPDGWEFFKRNKNFMPYLGILPDATLWALYRNPGSFNSLLTKINNNQTKASINVQLCHELTSLIELETGNVKKGNWFKSRFNQV